MTIRDSRVLLSCNTNLLDNLILFCLVLLLSCVITTRYQCIYLRLSDSVLSWFFPFIWIDASKQSIRLSWTIGRRYADSLYLTQLHFDVVFDLMILLKSCASLLWNFYSWEKSAWILVWVSMSWQLTSWISMLLILFQEKSWLRTHTSICVWLSLQFCL